MRNEALEIKRKERVYWIASFFVPLLITAVMLLLPMHAALTVTDGQTGDIVFRTKIHEGQTFKIQFIHSVHETPVIEHYRVTSDHTMMLEKVIYESYGVGNPSSVSPGETFRIESGSLILEGMKRKLSSIRLRIGQKIANHELIVRDYTAPFAAWIEPGSLVFVEVKRVSAIIVIFERRGISL